MKKHCNIPIFIPHFGCPHTCVFCNQRSITGKNTYEPTQVASEIEAALQTIDTEQTEVEIAFFGGSFTGIDRKEMQFLLQTAQHYVDKGDVHAIRLSTRPDYISEEILDILQSYRVKTIELGIQSMCNGVLDASQRGHTAEQSEKACRLVSSYGFELVGQMMIGLPKSSLETEVDTAEKLCQLGVHAARIYPTVVFPDTALSQQVNRLLYTPLPFEDALRRTTEAFVVFLRHEIPVIRIGLCASEQISCENYPTYHSAMGELVENEVFYDSISSVLDQQKKELRGKKVMIFVPQKATSKAIGQKRRNAMKLSEKYGIKTLKFIEKSTLFGYTVEVEIG